MFNVALPKGRLGEKAYNMFCKCGYGGIVADIGRKLSFCDENSGMNYFWVKPSDVAVYVERGAADIGVVGKDIIEENNPDVYELADLGIGKCKMCVAAKPDFVDNGVSPLRVATKFVHVAETYYLSVGRRITIIKLNGSVELAPILGLSDVIFDIVETGSTLKANGLRVITEVSPVSARLIANKAAYNFKNARIAEIAEKLSKVGSCGND